MTIGASFLGGLILIVGLQIPWLNILVWIGMVSFGLGAQLLEFRRQRPWDSATRSGAEQHQEVVDHVGWPDDRLQQP